MSTPVLYYVEIRNVADLETDETLALEAVVAGINYNGSATEFSWTVFPSNAGTFSDATDQRPIFTPSTGLSAAITAHVSVTATIYGTGDNSNLTATASDICRAPAGALQISSRRGYRQQGHSSRHQLVGHLRMELALRYPLPSLGR